jgi:putative transposase
MARPYQCAIHAYVLMTNHVHLLVTPGTVDAASNLMKHVTQRYSQFINRSRKRSGTLWEGRFHSNLVDSGTYLLTCQRYIELNPVRAGMVRSPGDYPWSSYHANAQGHPSLFVVPHPIVDALGETPRQRTLAYRSLFRHDLSGEELWRIRSSLSAGTALGSKEFEERMKTILGRRVTVGKPGRPRKSHEGIQREDQLVLV